MSAQERFRDSVEESKCVYLKKFISVESILAVQQELGSLSVNSLLDFLLQVSGNIPSILQLEVIWWEKINSQRLPFFLS